MHANNRERIAEIVWDAIWGATREDVARGEDMSWHDVLEFEDEFDPFVYRCRHATTRILALLAGEGPADVHYVLRTLARGEFDDRTHAMGLAQAALDKLLAAERAAKRETAFVEGATPEQEMDRLRNLAAERGRELYRTAQWRLVATVDEVERLRRQTTKAEGKRGVVATLADRWEDEARELVRTEQPSGQAIRRCAAELRAALAAPTPPASPGGEQ